MLEDFDAESLEDLMSRVAIGDERAFEMLYDQLAPRVFDIVVRVLRDPAQSEEVTQEIFVDIWRHAGRFDRSRSSAHTWTVSIAHRRAVDRVRSEQAARDRIERLGRHPAAQPATPAETVAVQFEQREAADALASLSDHQREVIELAYYEGLTHHEIAGRLLIPLGTVKTRARDGLARLRRRMGSA